MIAIWHDGALQFVGSLTGYDGATVLADPAPEDWATMPYRVEDGDLVPDLDALRLMTVPQTITIRQAREAVIRSGLLEAVEAGIDALEDATERALVRNYWEYSREVEREHPLIVTLGEAIGLTVEQIDDLFVLGASL